MKILKNNFYPIIIITLLIILLLQRCGNGSGSGKIQNNHSDTTFVYNNFYKDSTYTINPVKVIPVTSKILETRYLPSDKYDSLLIQFNELKQSLLASKVYKDSIPLDTFGYVKLTDTISENKIVSRNKYFNLKIPEKTITKDPPLKHKFFAGIGLAGNKEQVINDVNLGLGYLTKKDHLYTVKTRLDFNGNVYYEFSSFWKIKLKR